MSIIYDAAHRIFKLDAGESSYLLQVGAHNYLFHLYYGAHISDTDISYLTFHCPHAAFSPKQDAADTFNPDVIAFECPGNGCSDFRGSAITVQNADGNTATDFRYVSHRIYAGKPAIRGLPATYAAEDEADTLEILCRDAATGVETLLFYTAFRGISAITRHARVINSAERGVVLRRAMSTAVDFHTANGMDLICLYGEHNNECRFARSPLTHARTEVFSKRGASSHMHNPFLALCSANATEEEGEVWGFNLVYSGNFSASANLDTVGGARVLMGINPEDFAWRLDAGESFDTPEAVMVYSDRGLGEMSRTYHRLYRHHLCRGKWKTAKRPILINSWEAAYFNFDDDKLVAFAREAAALGVEMLVMDDGWFGKRNNDKCALGDWVVNEEKLKGGLDSLVRRVNALGMKFGIWFEPEMISPDSDLYRAHPDWALQVPNRGKSIGRHQYVLDMTRADVRDYLFDAMKKVLDSTKIDYIKWDFNRNLTEAGSALLAADRQGEVFHRFVLGLYELLERLLSAYPDLLLESCSGGGGRFDAGMLYYSPQVWASDNTDAMARLDIQYGTSLCYPASTMGAHVSAVPNHATRRTTPFDTRAAVAMAGTFGYELDPCKLSEEEKAAVREQCQNYHRYYPIVHEGELYRLIPPVSGDRNRAAWCHVSADKRQVLATYVVRRFDGQDRHHFRLAGLDPTLRYREEKSGRVLSGDTLMRAGYAVEERLFDGQSRTFLFVAEE